MAWAWGAGEEVGSCEVKRTDEEGEKRNKKSNKKRETEKEEGDGRW
jgi:hypothetical protein